MAPKKKQVRNPFYFFMVDYKAKLEKSTGRKYGMKEVAEIAGPIWSAMTIDEKEHYNRVSAAMKKKTNEDLTKKFTSLGVSYAELDAEEKEQEEQFQVMTQTVQTLVRSLLRDTTLRSEVFYFCHVNFFYKTDKGFYCPAEIALAEFNLGDGLLSTFHTFIKPGKMDLGYRYEATDWAQKTHNIPVDDPTWEGERDYANLFERVMQFFRKDPSQLPPIFTMPDSLNNNTSISAVKSLFAKMAEEADRDPAIFRIYPLPFLFFELRNHCVDDSKEGENSEFKYLPTVALAENEMERDVFTYAKSLGCEYHEEKDLATFCSLSIVVRWVFTICDHCCNQLCIPLVLGRHCPMDADVTRGMHQLDVSENKKPSIRKETSKPVQEVEKESKLARENNFMPTIIDHGKLREAEALKRETDKSASVFNIPEDVRLPHKATYSGAAKQKMGSDPVPRMTAKNFPEIGMPSTSSQPDKLDFPELPIGRGRGILRGGGLSGGAQQPNWPVSGRGSRKF